MGIDRVQTHHLYGTHRYSTTCTATGGEREEGECVLDTSRKSNIQQASEVCKIAINHILLATRVASGVFTMTEE